jgi:hypothetical protein
MNARLLTHTPKKKNPLDFHLMWDLTKCINIRTTFSISFSRVNLPLHGYTPQMVVFNISCFVDLFKLYMKGLVIDLL